MAEIVQLVIPPKTDLHRHRRIEYRLTYVPSTKQWAWEFSVMTVVRYNGMCESYDAAQIAAKVHIDLMEGG